MRLLLALLLTLLTLAAPLPAQRGGVVQIALSPRPGAPPEGPLVQTAGLLSRREMRELLRSGFPARLHYRVELWSVGGLVNDLEGSSEWDVIVRQDPLDGSFRVARIIGDQPIALLGTFETLADAERAIARPFRAPLVPRRRAQRYYYTASLDVEVLSLSDLDEVERWLRGELRPAVRGQRNPGTALTRGLRTLVVRLLGGEKRHYEARTGTFVVE